MYIIHIESTQTKDKKRKYVNKIIGIFPGCENHMKYKITSELESEVKMGQVG